MRKIKKEKKEPNPTRFWRSYEVRKVAEDLIPRFHVHLKDYTFGPSRPIRIEYLWTNKPILSKGVAAAAVARKHGGLNAYLAREDEIDTLVDVDGVPTPLETLAPDPFFSITVYQDGWVCLRADQRIALVDHELMHCGADISKQGRTILRIIPHDVEEFRAIIERHGTWNYQLQKFMEAEEDRRQPTLFEQAPSVEVVDDVDDVESVTLIGAGRSVTLTAESGLGFQGIHDGNLH